MPLADRLRITHVELNPEGDASFPAIDPSVWVLAEEIDLPRSASDTADYSVKLYLRR